MAIEFKSLRAGDEPVLDNVATDVFDDALDPRLVAEFLADPRHHLIVAVEDGLVIGFASGLHYVHPDKPGELWINEIGVAESYQRRGIGKRLIRLLLEHGARSGCREAWVLTDRSNDAAMRLYAAAGGREIPEQPVMFTFSLE